MVGICVIALGNQLKYVFVIPSLVI